MGCSICRDLQYKAQWDEAKASVDAFLKSSRAGCLVCEMILDAVEVFEPGWADNNNCPHATIKLRIIANKLWVDLRGRYGQHQNFRIFQSGGMLIAINNLCYTSCLVVFTNSV
jgi:hypothetical protein